MYNETLGKLSALLFFVGTNIVMGPLYLIGLDGMPRRYY